jgi:hypothetical protein
MNPNQPPALYQGTTLVVPKTQPKIEEGSSGRASTHPEQPNQPQVGAPTFRILKTNRSLCARDVVSVPPEPNRRSDGNSATTTLCTLSKISPPKMKAKVNYG